jgi:hypothetical protein
MLRNARGRFMHAWELFPVLGFRRGGHLPPGGFEPRNVAYGEQTVKFRCLPATEGRRKHRIEYLCRWCCRWVPYGRAGQHERAPAHPGHPGSTTTPEADSTTTTTTEDKS